MNSIEAASIVDSDAQALLALRLLADRPDVTQRQMSQTLGLSLGKTHFVLHALLDKGLVKIQNFKRSDRKLAYAYLLTADGLRTKMQLTRAFLAQKEAEFAALQSTIARLRQEVQSNSTSDPALHSDLRKA